MAKIIRPTYPVEFTIGLLLLLFFLSAFISFEIFEVSWQAVIEGEGPLGGMALAASAIVIMALILWEEFLFPVRLRSSGDQIVFRNHLTKLRTQLVIYCLIPVIVVLVYLKYEVHPVAFFIWASICLTAPVAGTLISGLRNYNDFLKLTVESIQYRNNNHVGEHRVKDIQRITLLRDESGVLHKIRVAMKAGEEQTIDLDEMELNAYLQTIDDFIRIHFATLLEDEEVSKSHKAGHLPDV